MASCRECMNYNGCTSDWHKLSQVEHICNHFENKADVVEVVRCKDCDFATRNPYVDGQYICEKTRHNSRTGELVGKILVIDTDFCNYGIRKTN